MYVPLYCTYFCNVHTIHVYEYCGSFFVSSPRFTLLQRTILKWMLLQCGHNLGTPGVFRSLPYTWIRKCVVTRSLPKLRNLYSVSSKRNLSSSLTIKTSIWHSLFSQDIRFYRQPSTNIVTCTLLSQHLFPLSSPMSPFRT